MKLDNFPQLVPVAGNHCSNQIATQTSPWTPRPFRTKEKWSVRLGTKNKFNLPTEKYEHLNKNVSRTGAPIYRIVAEPWTPPTETPSLCRRTENVWHVIVKRLILKWHQLSLFYCERIPEPLIVGMGFQRRSRLRGAGRVHLLRRSKVRVFWAKWHYCTSCPDDVAVQRYGNGDNGARGWKVLKSALLYCSTIILRVVHDMQ